MNKSFFKFIKNAILSIYDLLECKSFVENREIQFDSRKVIQIVLVKRLSLIKIKNKT